jgi:hypothetical protein
MRIAPTTATTNGGKSNDRPTKTNLPILRRFTNHDEFGNRHAVLPGVLPTVAREPTRAVGAVSGRAQTPGANAMNSLDKNKAVVTDAATDAINARMEIGALKYDPNDWRGESVARHVRRAVKHAITHLEISAGDRPDDGENHLAAAVCRLAMAVAVSRESQVAIL